MRVLLVLGVVAVCAVAGVRLSGGGDPTVESPMFNPPDVSKILPGTLPLSYGGPFMPWAVADDANKGDLDAEKAKKKISAASGVNPAKGDEAARHDTEPESVPSESYTMDSSRTDLSAGNWRSTDNARKYDADLFAHAPKPYNVHDLFQNGVDMSWALAKKMHEGHTAHLSTGFVDDGLRFGSTFGEDIEESGAHAFPDTLPPTSKWNPVPPNFRPRFPMGGSLADNLADPAPPRVFEAQPEHANPDGLGGASGSPSAPNAFRKSLNSQPTDLGPFPERQPKVSRSVNEVPGPNTKPADKW